MQGAVGELRHLGQFAAPDGGEAVAIRFGPMGIAHHAQRHVLRFHRSDQADAALDLAIVKHDAGGRHLHYGTPRSLVDQELGARIGKFGGRHRAGWAGCACAR